MSATVEVSPSVLEAHGFAFYGNSDAEGQRRRTKFSHEVLLILEAINNVCLHTEQLTLGFRRNFLVEESAEKGQSGLGN